MPECAKFKLTDHTKTINGATVYRIQSLKQFYTIDGNTVLYGQMGGFVSDPEILSQYDKSWVGGNADGSVCDSSALIHAHIEGYHVKGNSRVRGVHFYGQGNIVDSIIDVRGRFHLLLSCEFNKAKITDASQFFFVTLGHWLMLDVAIYPSIEGELLACYAAYGVRSDVVPFEEVDKRVRENKIIPEKLWDSVVALSREFTKEKFDA